MEKFSIWWCHNDCGTNQACIYYSYAIGMALSLFLSNSNHLSCGTPSIRAKKHFDTPISITISLFMDNMMVKKVIDLYICSFFYYFFLFIHSSFNSFIILPYHSFHLLPRLLTYISFFLLPLFSFSPWSFPSFRPPSLSHSIPSLEHTSKFNSLRPSDAYMLW